MKRSHERIETWMRWIAIAGVIACAAWATYTLIDAGRFPKRYHPTRFQNLEAPADWIYPTDTIASWVSAFVLEVLGASWFVRHAEDFTAKVFFVLGVACGIVGLFIFGLSTGAPQPSRLQGLWLLFACGWLLAMAAVSALARFVVPPSAEEPKPINPPPKARVIRG